MVEKLEKYFPDFYFEKDSKGITLIDMNYSNLTIRFDCVCPRHPDVKALGCSVHTPEQSWPVTRALWRIGQLERLEISKQEQERLSAIFSKDAERIKSKVLTKSA